MQGALQFWISHKDVRKYLFTFLGNFDTFLFFHLKAIHLLKTREGSVICEVASGQGYLKVLKWARSHGLPWDEWTCYYAAANGHLEILQWARSQVPPCPWDSATCYIAAITKHLEILQWCQSNGAPYNQTRVTYYLEGVRPLRIPFIQMPF